MSDIPKGSGIIRKIGWDKNDRGEEVFRAIIDFPNGPPSIPWTTVFDLKPVSVIETIKQ